MKMSQGGPASKVIWKLGTHHVEISTPISAMSPNKELHGPGGAKRRMSFPVRVVARRNAKWVAKIMIQMNGPPKKATPIMNTNAVFLNSCDSTSAATMPTLETSTAATGMPRLFRRPSRNGAYPPRASENSKRDVKYTLQVAADNAAVSTTKFMMCP